jgi:hypothetical protein
MYADKASRSAPIQLQLQLSGAFERLAAVTRLGQSYPQGVPNFEVCAGWATEL